nr:multisubstrate pseudouridine synthase 7 [Quercus suber]
MTEKREMDADERQPKRQRLEEPVSSLPDITQTDQERAVGITHYVSASNNPFSCVVKQRYTDFLVNEILPSGRVLHLETAFGPDPVKQQRRKATKDANNHLDSRAPGEPTELMASEHEAPESKLPVPAEPPSEVQSIQLENADHQSTSLPQTSGEPATTKEPAHDSAAFELSAEDTATLNGIFGESTTAQIVSLYRDILAHPERKPRDHVSLASEVISEKSKRTEAHIASRRIFHSKIETSTLQDQPGVIEIKAAPPPSQGRNRNTQNAGAAGAVSKGKIGWDELGGEYLHFTLFKENKDTMEVLYFIAAQLKIPAKTFQFAGTKDRRGVTVQKVAVYRVHASRIIGLGRMAKAWVAGDFEYKKRGLDLGELTGNEFVLTLRDCTLPTEVVGENVSQSLESFRSEMMKAAETFRTRGFINYYGLQRFGSFSTGTHAVGRKILQGDLEGAINDILSYSPSLLPENQGGSGDSKVPHDDIARADTIRNWRKEPTSNAAVVHKMPRRFQAETAIMQYLGKKGRDGKYSQDHDWQGALMMIQRGLRLMYVHAYQSLVWNTAASQRWEMFGQKVVEGDLIIVGEKDGDSSSKVEVDEDGEPIVQPAADDSAGNGHDPFLRARALSSEEAESGKYDIFDVVLPQPGFDIVYPANAIGKFYEEFMASAEGGGLDPYKMRRSWKDISLSGGYRKLLVRPGKDFSLEVKEYEDDNQQLVETDVEKLRRSNSGFKGSAEHSNGANDVNGFKQRMQQLAQDQGIEKKDKKLAVVLKMQLGSSQYATMALRELTKGGAMAYKPDYSVQR